MDFLKAVQNGHYEAVRSALGKVDIDYQDERVANSALHVAVTAKRNKTKLIELLITAGADCDLKNRDGLTASELALECGCRTLAEFMMRKEFEGWPDDRAVYRLVRRGSVELLRIYLEKRAFDIHTKMKLIRRVVDELTVKGVTIADRMKVFLEFQLVEYSYRYGMVTGGGGGIGTGTVGGPGTRKKGTDGGGDKEAEKRVELILSYTKYLKENYDGNDLNDLDDRFVLRLRMICECCYFLEDIERRRERKLYKHVPFTEITYLIGVFLAILEKLVGFEIYKLIINKNMIISYLEAVCRELRTATLGEMRRHENGVSFQWSSQLLLDLTACIREERLLRYVARRKRLNDDLQRIAAMRNDNGDGQLGPVDQELVMNEIRRKEFQSLQEGVQRAAGEEANGKWCASDFVSLLRCERKTIVALWQQRHPKLRLSKRQVQFVMGRRELNKIKQSVVQELSKNKMKLVEKEVNSREFQALARTVCRRNRIVFRRIRKTFDQIKQMYTVKKIAYYVENAIVIDMDDVSNEQICILTIKRVLQLMDESIKSCDQNPAFVRTLENVLDHVMSSVKITNESSDIRDFYSQKYSLAKYFANKSLDISQYKLMQDSLRSVYRFFLYVINIQLIEAYKTFLGTAYRLPSLAQIKSYAKYIGDHNLHTLSHIQFEHVFYNEDETAGIIRELKKMYLGMSNELKLLSFIEKNIHFRFYHMQYHQTRLRVTLSNFSVVYRALRANPCYDSIRKLLHSYLNQSYQKYDISKSISISDSTLALKELLRPYSSVRENEETLMVVRHLEQLQELMDPDRLFGINPVRCRKRSGEVGKYHQFTRKILKEMGLQLNDDEFRQLHEKLRRTYYENIFLLQNRYRIMGEFFKQRAIAVDGKVLAGYKERDEELLQELFDSKVNDVIQILEKFECGAVDGVMESLGEIPPFVHIALEFALLELLDILGSVNGLGTHVGGMLRSSSTPVLSGRALKSYLEQDSLVLDLLVFRSNATICVNALVFKNFGFKLYGGGGVQLQEAPAELVEFKDRYNERWKWFEMQEILYESVRKGDLKLLKENVDNGSDLRGKRFGPLVMKELCHYSLIDCAIAGGGFRDMIAMLNRDYEEIGEERRQLLEYLLRRTVKSHFLVGQYCKLKPEDRKMLVLYLSMFLGNVGVFLRNLERYSAHGDLHLFVNSENHKFVSEMLQELKGFEFNRYDSSGLTILHKIVNAGNLQAVQVLARMKGVELNGTNSLKYTALNLACRLNLLDIVNVLVQHRADVNVMSEDEKLPVFWLIQYQNPRELVSLAIDSSTELTSFSSELCLLHKAIEFDNLDVVKYLIEEQKVDPGRIYSNCNNVVHAAASYNRARVLSYLLTISGLRKLVNNTNLVKNTPLNIACKEGYLGIARKLLGHGVRTDTCGEYGLNALAFAMYTNSFKLVKLLFQHGATISYPLSSDFQPINMAIINRNIPMLKFLLKNGVDVNSAPLCFINTVYSQTKEFVSILVGAGSRHINFKDEFCQTAFHLCVERDEYDTAQELIRAGADINAKNRSGMTPLHLAVVKGNVRFVQLLLDHRCQVDALNYHGETSLIKSVVCNNLDIVKILLNNGASVERLRNSEPSVLLYLVQENYEDILDYLLEHYQFNPNEQDAYGNSLLYVATQHNHINIVKLLVDKYHAQTNTVNNKKLTPLMIARVKEFREIFSFLEAHLTPGPVAEE